MDNLKQPADYLNRILHGDALQLLRSLPSGSIDVAVTSPPYYQQRNYESHAAQIGQEPTPQEYVAKLVEVFHELRRVLNDRGSLWLVLGDKYQQGRQLGMPWRTALAMQDDGWILRNDIVWHKPNAMPSSAKNRLTVDHEYVFFFVKSLDYHYDADAIREPHVTFSESSRMRGGRRHFFQRGGTPELGKNRGDNNLHDGRWDQAFHPQGRNKRTVWSVPLSKCREAHFAVFPDTLVQTCILAASPEKGVVLDPFCGSGTTCRVAQQLGRSYVGLECAEKYCRMAEKAVAQKCLTEHDAAEKGVTEKAQQRAAQARRPIPTMP